MICNLARFFLVPGPSLTSSSQLARSGDRVYLRYSQVLVTSINLYESLVELPYLPTPGLLLAQPSMSSPTPSTAESCQATLLRWGKSGISSEERDDFVGKALLLPADETQDNGTHLDISNIGQIASDVYYMFSNVAIWCPRKFLARWEALWVVSQSTFC